MRTSESREIVDAPLHRQVGALEEAVSGNPVARTILTEAPALELPNWYLGAGGVTGSVWNLLHGFDHDHGIKDYDIVYFDPDDVTRQGEQAVERRANDLFEDLGIRLDVTNEARVHLWYEERFGRTIDPYRSTEHAISTWPSTASSIGVRYDGDSFTVCAPFGLRDVLAMVVRPNRDHVVGRTIYEAKTARWRSAWPRLEIVPW